MAGTGINGDTGLPLSGFDHVRQSIGVILTTRIGSRVMRRDFGSELQDLIDRPMTDQVILAIYSAVAMSIARWEPRFSVTKCALLNSDPSGSVDIELRGIYFPRGHLGDFSGGEGQSASFVIAGIG